MEDKSKKCIQVLIGVVTHLTSLSPSMAFGFSAIMVPILTNSANPDHINNDQASWVASSVSITYPIGCIFSSSLSDKYGRKAVIILSNVIAFLGWLVVYLGYILPIHQYELLIIGRLITGVSCGMILTMPIIYMTEISTPSTRSMFTTWNAIAYAIGILFAFVLGSYFQEDWGKVAITATVLPIISCILTIICLPESPQWLISQNRLEEAERCQKMLGHPENEEAETTPLLQTLSEEPSSYATLCYSLLKPTIWKPMIIVLSYVFFVQFCGVFVLLAYAVDFAQQLQINLNPYWIICIIGVIRLVGAILLGVISNNFGRRPLSLVSGIGMSVCMLGLALYLFLISKFINQSIILSLVALLLVVVYFFVAAIGFLALPYAMSSELFPRHVRGFACGFITFVGCILNFLSIKIYFNMITWLGSYFMLLFFYGLVSTLATIFIYFYLPETNRKSFEEIEQCFLQGLILSK